MAEHIQKTDEEIEWEEMVHNAEQEDLERRRKKSFVEFYMGVVFEVTRNAVCGLLFWAVLPFLFFYMLFYWGFSGIGD